TRVTSSTYVLTGKSYISCIPGSKLPLLSTRPCFPGMGSFRHIVPTNGHVVFVLLITMYPKLSLRYDGIFWQRWGCSNYLIYPLVPPFYVCINCIICYLITCNHCFQCRVGWVRWECFSSHL